MIQIKKKTINIISQPSRNKHKPILTTCNKTIKYKANINTQKKSN